MISEACQTIFRTVIMASNWSFYRNYRSMKMNIVRSSMSRSFRDLISQVILQNLDFPNRFHATEFVFLSISFKRQNFYEPEKPFLRSLLSKVEKADSLYKMINYDVIMSHNDHYRLIDFKRVCLGIWKIFATNLAKSGDLRLRTYHTETFSARFQLSVHCALIKFQKITRRPSEG